MQAILRTTSKNPEAEQNDCSELVFFEEERGEVDSVILYAGYIADAK